MCDYHKLCFLEVADDDGALSIPLSTSTCFRVEDGLVIRYQEGRNFIMSPDQLLRFANKCIFLEDGMLRWAILE